MGCSKPQPMHHEYFNIALIRTNTGKVQLMSNAHLLTDSPIDRLRLPHQLSTYACSNSVVNK